MAIFCTGLRDYLLSLKVADVPRIIPELSLLPLDVVTAAGSQGRQCHQLAVAE